MNISKTSLFLLTFLLLSAGNLMADDKEGWTDIKVDNLEEWSDPSDWWKEEEGVIFAESQGGKNLPPIHYLFWNGSLKGDFELSLEYRIIATEPQDAGVNFRIEHRDKMNNNNLIGYQAELDTAFLYGKMPFIRQGKLFGNIHDGKRTRMFKRSLKVTIAEDGSEKQTPLPKKFVPRKVFRKPPEWNQCHIVVKGNHIKLYLNDVLANELIDEDVKMKSTGDAIALQFRPNNKHRYEVRNIRYKLTE